MLHPRIILRRFTIGLPFATQLTDSQSFANGCTNSPGTLSQCRSLVQKLFFRHNHTLPDGFTHFPTIKNIYIIIICILFI